MNDVVKIITVILGISILTLIINRANDSVALINASAGGFNSILKTITLQGNDNG
jgi:hypothetical protein